MLVYLLRHGIAAELGESGVRSDAERPLTKEGIKKLREAAHGYRKLLERPVRVLSSPLLRARESAEILCEVLELPSQVEHCAILVPEADPRDVISLLQSELMAGPGRGPFLLVGHEPHLGRLLGLLLSGSEHATVPFRKGMLVGVDLDEPRSMIGQLVLALRQRDGRRLA